MRGKHTFILLKNINNVNTIYMHSKTHYKYLL